MSDAIWFLEVDGQRVGEVSDVQQTTTAGKFVMWPPTRDQATPQRLVTFKVRRMFQAEGVAALVDENGWTVHELQVVKLDTRIVPGEGAVITVSAKIL